MAIIKADGLVKRFGNVVALDELCLNVERGVTGLIGPNGSGKTTTIGIILGLLKPDRGEVSVFGLDPWRHGREVRSRIGVLHEKPFFPREMTGRRFLRYVASFYGVSDPEAEVGKLLRLLDLEEAADREIKGYSAGMVQRLGIAQALIGDPELVILDEPTANLDPMGRAKVLDLIGSIARDRGKSFLISTHILSELEKVCWRVSIIFRGRILAEGSVSDLMGKFKAEEFEVRAMKLEAAVKLLRHLSSVRDIRVDGERGTVIVRVHDPTVFQEEALRKAYEMGMHNVSINPRYGVLEAIYRKVIPSEEGETA